MSDTTTYAQAQAEKFAEDCARIFDLPEDARKTVHDAYRSGLYTRPSNLEIWEAYEAMAKQFDWMKKEYTNPFRRDDLLEYATIALETAWKARNLKQLPTDEARAYAEAAVAV